MTDDSDRKEIILRYRQVDGRMQIDIDSDGFERDPNLIALYLSFTLEQLVAQSDPDSRHQD